MRGDKNEGTDTVPHSAHTRMPRPWLVTGQRYSEAQLYIARGSQRADLSGYLEKAHAVDRLETRLPYEALPHTPLMPLTSLQRADASSN